MQATEERGFDPAVGATRALAAHVLELAATRRWRDFTDLVHPEAELVLGGRRGAHRPLRGEALRRWLRRADGGERELQLEPRVTSIEVLEPGVALATGTLRSPLPGRGHVFTQATWVLVFREGLLYRIDRRATLSEARALARIHVVDAADGPSSRNSPAAS